jgi:hypothetical protein
MPKINVKCAYCDKIISKYNNPKTKKYFCNKTCKALFSKGKTFEELHGDEKAKEVKQKMSKSGELNSNFGHKWSDDKKEAQSKIVKDSMDRMGPELRKEACGKSNRGLKRSQEFLDKWHSTQRDPNYIHPKHSDEAKKLIGKKSAAKFKDPDYVNKVRKIMEDAGHWTPLEQKTDFQIYYAQANWVKRMWDIVDSPLLSEIGVFNSSKNTKGAVRDHMFGRKSGFESKVFPEILRHPANCQIVSHSFNVSKKSSRYIDRNDITLEHLFNLILEYKEPWEEQELCVSLIEDYKNGKRWEK